ncbi:alkaline phosphatase D family protein [Salegentibacter sediminis]|uniref:alkaline phosphatase D family protein n=1 Tax=Salegentibacter sediminis TaxID=1930251 RepID=UPI0009BCAF17|nr:alkaline phosphatase D family protein [Salegentibacter sediminis]
MKLIFRILPFFILFSCGSTTGPSKKYPEENYDFVLAFGSCNKQEAPQPLWEPILKNEPDVFVWGGDNIYADTPDMQLMQEYYRMQQNMPGYKQLSSSIPVLGTWDDHDYGINDGGKEWEFKEESQQLFLDFMGVPQDDPRREREGVYHSELFETPKGSIKLIVLDSRYFRDELEPDDKPGRRYKVNNKGTILGEQQWRWLEEELETSNATFNLILSSIQVISQEHGFETWGNFPAERKRLLQLIEDSAAKNIIILSGDRHISEFSEMKLEGLNYPMVDFTSSGLTHSYTGFSGEPNRYRTGEVVSDLSFGLLKFDFKNNQVHMEMRGEENRLLQHQKVEYPHIKH